MCWCCTIHLKSCWTPCFWYGDVRSGSVAVSVYTLAMSICLIIYTINVMAGGDSSQLWLPFFETSLKDSSGLGGPGTTMGSGGFVIIYLFFLCLSQQKPHFKLDNLCLERIPLRFKIRTNITLHFCWRISLSLVREGVHKKNEWANITSVC